MRTAKEIRAYLKQQHWYKEYVRKARSYPNTFNRSIRGYFGESTLYAAFFWGCGREISIWCHRKDLFVDWYNRGKKRYEGKKVSSSADGPQSDSRTD